MQNQDYTSAESTNQDGWTRVFDLVNEPAPPVSWVVDGLLSIGGLSIIAARPKVGKSTVARSMAIAVAQGHQKWLGRKVTQGLVLYVNLEEHRTRVAKHFSQFQITDKDDLLLRFGPPSGDGMTWLKKEVDKHQPALVIVDPMIDLLKVHDINEYAAVARALAGFLKIAQDTGAHICLIHHAKKDDTNQGRELLGSTALLGRVDCAIILDKDDNKRRTFYTIQRDGTDVDPPVELLLAADGSVNVGRNVNSIKLDEIADDILEFLKSQQQPADTAAIRLAVGHRHKLVSGVLRKLVLDMRLVKTGTGKSGKPFLYTIK